MPTKTCTKCNAIKTLDNFSKASREKDGLQDWCKPCCTEANRLNKLRRIQLKGVESTRPAIADHEAGGTAWCASCKDYLPISRFGKRIGRCKDCACKQARESRARMIEAESKLPRSHPKLCGCCKAVKTLTEFQVGQHRCKDCQNRKTAESDARNPNKKKDRTKRYCAENKEKKAASLRLHRVLNKDWWSDWNRRYYNTPAGRLSRVNIMHRRRTAERQGSVTTEQMMQIEAKAKGCCHYCHCKTEKLTFDHVIPIARGGKHEAENLVMACFPCNRSKGAKDPLEYAQSIGRLLV